MTLPEMTDLFRHGHDNDAGFDKHSSSPFTASSLLLLDNATLPGNATGGRADLAGGSGSAAAGGVGSSPQHPLGGEEAGKRWGVLGLLAIIVCSIVGNVLVCLAVCWERRLQNMTNYFLMSLAIADLLVSVVVMPLGMIVELFGYFPLETEVCVVWVSSDVLMCTASIWHMCTMSMDRYFTLKYPMRYGRNKTKTMVMLKIFFVWVVSMAISSPICIHGFVDPSIVYNDGMCVPVLKDFVIYGSVFAFYIPLLIMIVTYVLTIRILWSNQQLMQRINQTDLRPGLAQMTAQCTGFAMPQMPRLITPVTDDVNSEDVLEGDKNNGNALGAGTARGGGGGVSVVAASPTLPNPSLLMPQSPLSPQPASPSPPAPSSPQHQHLQMHQVGPRLLTRPRSKSQLREDTDSEDEDGADQPNACLLQDKSMSYRSLCARVALSASHEEFFARAAASSDGTTTTNNNNNSNSNSISSPTSHRLSPSEKSGSFREPREQRKASNHLNVPSLVMYRRGGGSGGGGGGGGGGSGNGGGRLGPALYSTASDTQLPSAGCRSASLSPDTSMFRQQPAFHQSFGGLETDAKSAEWDRRFFQIQQEMDACLMDAEGSSNGNAGEVGGGGGGGGGSAGGGGAAAGDGGVTGASACDVVGGESTNPTSTPNGGGAHLALALGDFHHHRTDTWSGSHSATNLWVNCNNNNNNGDGGGGRGGRGGDNASDSPWTTRRNTTSSRPPVPSNLQISSSHHIFQNHKNPRSRLKALSRSLPSHSVPPKRRAPPPPRPKPRQPPSPQTAHTSDSDNDADTSGSSANSDDVITIRLHPPSSPHNKTPSSAQHSSEEMTENSVLRSVVVSSEADNTQDDSDVLNTNDDSPANDSRDHVLRRSGKHKRLLKARFRNTLRASTRPMFKHLMSKKTASNERKASKVLGIIFLVFVILWTPFFIVNILSVTCASCMQGLTGDMMSVFIWMGYVASLANPIIYTMFNTAFRRTFIKILTCSIKRAGRMKFTDLPTFPSMTTTVVPSERRGTMTVLLDHRT